MTNMQNESLQKNLEEPIKCDAKNLHSSYNLFSIVST
jgi:hypothetical protein